MPEIRIISTEKRKKFIFIKLFFYQEKTVFKETEANLINLNKVSMMPEFMFPHPSQCAKLHLRKALKHFSFIHNTQPPFLLEFLGNLLTFPNEFSTLKESLLGPYKF